MSPDTLHSASQQRVQTTKFQASLLLQEVFMAPTEVSFVVSPPPRLVLVVSSRIRHKLTPTLFDGQATMQTKRSITQTTLARLASCNHVFLRAWLFVCAILSSRRFTLVVIPPISDNSNREATVDLWFFLMGHTLGSVETGHIKKTKRHVAGSAMRHILVYSADGVACCMPG